MNPPTPPSPPVTSGGQGPPPSPLKIGKESVRPGPESFKTDVIPSSSHTPTTGWNYEVFLSFRGEDSRKSFTEHLCHALVQRGISTIRGDQLEPGKPIGPSVFKAIEESRCVIVILSNNYAKSTRCLDELAKAVECRKVVGQKVFPVFYDVYPYEVRTQTGYFGEAFSQHEQRFKDDTERIQKWRSALTEVANLTGWDLRHGNDAKGVQDIVERVFIELNSAVLSQAQGLVGMEYRVQQVLSCLGMSRFLGVRVIGIWGMAGIGKTTIAQVVFESISSQFDACSFLVNVREVTEGQGLVHLQQQLLSDTLPQTNANIHEIDMGIEIIKQRLCAKKVLIILDDVDRLETLKALCGSHDWFGPGSRIIITSRDRGLLCAYGSDEIYDVEALNEDEAFKLFGWKCFKKYQIEEDFLQLSKHVLKYSSGLPLAIQVFGSFLYGKNVEEWSIALKGLEENSEKLKLFKVCIDGLSETDKKVFLDIACFHNGEDIYRVTRILESSIGVLVDKSLVTLSGRKLWMHDLIQEMGRAIVIQECPEDPGKRSRLWLPKDIIHILANNKGTSTIEGIFLNLPEEEEVELTIDPFLKMRNLKYLKVCNVKFSGNLKYLCDELRLLDWHECPLKYLPSDFQPDKLVELIMQSSHIKQLWSEVKRCNMLKVIDLSDSQYLIETPDLTDVPNIETLVFEGCTSLVEVHRSIGVLKKLVLLNMRNCMSVQTLPPFIDLESLQVLTLSGCSKLKEFPEIKGKMESLLELHLDRTGIEELTQEIECLTSLSFLNLEHCENLRQLPTAILDMPNLTRVNLTACPHLSIPEDLSFVEYLEELDIRGTARGGGGTIVLGTDALKQKVENEEDKSPSELQKLFLYCSLFPSNYEFRKHELVQLWIANGFIMEERNGETMEDVGIRHFDSLENKGFFKQSRCDFEADFDSVFSVPMYSPSSFFYKVNPVELSLLENRSSSAGYFRAVDSKLDAASESTTKDLSLICKEDINEMIFGVLPKFKKLRTLLLLPGHGSSIESVPGDLFLSLNVLTTLNLSRTLISELPSSIGDVQPLRYLDVSYTLITRLPESIGSLNKLQTLKLRGCKDLFDLPSSVHGLTALRHLDFDIIRQLDFMPAHLGKLSKLQSLSAFLVGSDDGRRIGELKNLKDLGGALRIFRLENVLNKADAEEVDLKNKKRLQRLDFRWTKMMGKNKKMHEDILESLRPPTGLKELQILFYNGTKLPSWLSDTSITDLVVITLYKCANCDLLPSLGRLPKLKFLSIVEMNKVTEVDQTFFGSIDHQKPFKAFPTLEILEVDGMLNLKDWKEIQEGDLESLIKLTMENCPELVTVPSFSRLKSLKYLEFNHCPELLSLDRSALPTSLESLIIRDCPKLKEWCHKEGHQDLSFHESRS